MFFKNNKLFKMPEGPEVYKMRDLFNPGKIIIKPTSKIKKYQINLSGILKKAVARGKHIYLYIDNRILLIQPLMAGIVIKSPKQNIHIYAITNAGRELFIADPMNLINVKFVDAEANLGPDCMNPQKDDVDKIYKKISRRRIELARIMLDQKVFAGCGNYLRAEALYCADIPALIKAPKVSRQMIEKLWTVLTNIAARVYRGDYKLQIYQKKISPCGRDIKTIVLNRRKLYYVKK